MRYILTGSLLMVGLLASHARSEAVTTAPSVSEVQTLRAQVRALQSENDMLRAQVAALSAGSGGGGAGAAGPQGLPNPSDAPLPGIDAIFQGFPKDQVPTPEDPSDGLRHSLMRKWVRDQGIGRIITLRGKFEDATGISAGHFILRVGTGPLSQASHPFEATVSMPESEASSALRFRKSSPVQITGRIRSIDVARTSDGLFVIILDLDLANITTDNPRSR